MRISTLGDLLLDVVVRPDGAFRSGDDVRANTSVTVGGQAANVAAWAAALGATARLVAARGTDLVADLLTADLAARGVTTVGPRIDGPTGTVVALLDQAGERSMMSDRGVSPGFHPADLRHEWFTDTDHLHITGYSLLAEPFADTAMSAAHNAHANGARVSLDLSAAHLIHAAGGDTMRRRIAVVGPHVIFGTAAEFAALDGPVDAPVIIEKRGPAGATLTWRGVTEEIPAPSVHVRDATGAGDAFAAGFLLGATREQAIAGALAAAGRCLATMGAMPPTDGATE